jgi:hypothetical protein
MDASASPDATTNGWSVGGPARISWAGSIRSQPLVVRTQGIEGDLPDKLPDVPSHRHDSDPMPKINSKMPAIKRIGIGRGP